MPPADSLPPPGSHTSASGAAQDDPHAASTRLLTQRLEHLEQENRKLKRQGMTVLVIVAVLLGIGVALVVTAARHGMPGFVPDVVEAKEFMMRDGDGRVRGRWGTDENGAIQFVLQNHESATSIKLNLLDDGSSGLTFTDSVGTPRLVVAVLPDHTVNLVLGDQRGVARTVLGLNPNGSTSLVFADQGGTTRTGIGVDSRGRSMLSVGPEPAAPAEEVVDTVPAPPPPARRR